MKDNEFLLVKQKVKGTKKTDRYAYESLLEQSSNRQILGTTPYLYFYFVGEKFYDKNKIQRQKDSLVAQYDRKLAIKEMAMDTLAAQGLKKSYEYQQLERKYGKLNAKREKKLKRLDKKLREGNWFMRVVGEPPVIYDSTKMEKSAENMRKYLFKKGYFRGVVRAEPRKNPVTKRVKITYQIEEGLRQKIRKVEYETDDSNIKKIIKSQIGKALVQTEDYFDEDLIVAERERLYELLRNNGYYGFSREYIFIDIDTTFASSRRIADIIFIIKNPSRAEHQSFSLDKINFRIEESNYRGSRDTLLEQDITFITDKKKYPIRILTMKTDLKKQELYNHQRLVRTQTRLTSLDMFKFVNLSFDTLGKEKKINVNIYTSLLKKYEIGTEAGLAISQGPPGPFGSVFVKVRNALGGFEILQFGSRIFYEGQISPFLPDTVIYQAREFSLNTSLTFPTALAPFHAFRTWLDKYNTRTTLLFNVSNVVRPEYTRNVFQGAFNYNLFLNQREQLQIGLLDANVINTPTDRINAKFADYLENLLSQGNNLILNFRRSLVTNSNVSYTYNSLQNNLNKNSYYVRVQVEWGGLSSGLLAQRFGNERQELFDLAVFRYWKLFGDYRKYIPTTPSSTLVIRLLAGLAQPWGSSNTIPYEKFFFMGGSNSIRAWRPRRLGPGSYNPVALGQPSIEQTGELAIEANIEERFKITGVFEGAVFVDMGNIWMVTNDERSRPGSQLQANTFYQEIAIGSGFGLRLNFSFFILRLDAAFRVYDPLQPEGKRIVVRDASLQRPLGQSQGFPLMNLGIGYPF